jgi:hypothetical protein
MSLRSLASLTVVLVALFPTRAFAQHNALTPEEKAEGWTLLFDGKTFPEGLEGDAKIVDGVLVLGGTTSTKARLVELRGGSFELRFEYRTEGATLPMMTTRWRQFLGSGSVGGSLPRVSRGPDDWIEVVFTGRDQPDGRVDVDAKWRTVGEANWQQGLQGSNRGASDTSVWLETPAAGKVYLRNLRVLGDLSPPLWPWLLGGSVVVLLLALVGFVWWRRRARPAPQYQAPL